MDDIGDQDIVSKLINKRSDNEFLELMANLGGHCVPTLCDAFNGIKDDKPTAFIAYTIKGWGTPLAGHKDNHAGLMTKIQMDSFKSKFGITEGNEWNSFLDGKENLSLSMTKTISPLIFLFWKCKSNSSAVPLIFSSWIFDISLEIFILLVSGRFSFSSQDELEECEEEDEEDMEQEQLNELIMMSI